jgi:8-oxo-dGTP pyrophosphatase MutT (NUDIX family)
LFEDHPFSIFVDRIECNVLKSFQLSAVVDQKRQATWDAFRAKHPTAFDGALLRMANHRVEAGRLIIDAHRTSYSAYVTTRHPEFADEHPGAERADPLGMTAIVLTKDSAVIVTKRSLSADQNPGALYLIGGYAEPLEKGKTVDLFSEVAREVMEEIAVKDLNRSTSFAIGIAYDPVFCHPELFLLTVSQSTFSEILEGAHEAPDRNEAAELIALPLLDFIQEQGPFPAAPKTWSFTKARAFLAQHLLGHTG